MELLDDNQMRTINISKATSRNWAEKPTLFIKFEGTKAGVREAIDIVGKIAKQNNGGKFEFARNEKEQKDLWSARKVDRLKIEVIVGSVVQRAGVEGG